MTAQPLFEELPLDLTIGLLLVVELDVLEAVSAGKEPSHEKSAISPLNPRSTAAL